MFLPNPVDYLVNPLKSGCSDTVMDANVRKLLHEGYSYGQAAAIVFSKARRSGCDTLPKARRKLRRNPISAWHYNQPGYRYYVVSLLGPNGNKIDTGWEFLNDAIDRAKEAEEFAPPHVRAVVWKASYLRRVGIDPEDDRNWGSFPLRGGAGR